MSSLTISQSILVSLTIGLGVAGLGFDVVLVAGLLSNPLWFEYFGIVPGSALLGPVLATFTFAAVAAAIPSAFISDYIGRKKSIIIACLLNIAGVFGQTFATDLRTFIATRALTGFATGIVLTNSAAYVNEVICTPRRAQYTALSQTTFFIGSITAAWSSFGALHLNDSWSWRLILIFQLPWPLLQLILVLFCPESPRWLVMRGKIERARKILYHTTPEHAEELLSRLRSANTTDSTWCAFLQPRNRLRMCLIVLLGLATQLTGGGVISYYLPPILALVGIRKPLQQSGMAAGIQMCSFVFAVLGASLVDRIGRKRLLVLSSMIMLVCLSILTACSAVYVKTESKVSAIVVIISIFAFSASSSTAYSGVPGLYITELVPTEMRAKASALIAGFAGIGSCFNQWINPIAFTALQWRYFLIYIGTLTFTALFLSLFAPETKGLDLEQAAKLCNHDDVETVWPRT